MKGTNVPNSRLPVLVCNAGDEVALNNITGSGRAHSPETRCQMQIVFVFDPRIDRWFLHDNTHLEHKFHHELPSKATVLAAADLSDSEEAWVEQMYDVGLSSGTIAGVMTGYFNKKRQEGAISCRWNQTHHSQGHKGSRPSFWD